MTQFRRFFATTAGAAVLSLVAAGGDAVAQAPAGAPPPAWYFAASPALDNVRISPDGKHIAALASPDGKTVNVAVWSTDALDKPPVFFGASKMRILALQFIKNDRVAVVAQQLYTAGVTRTHLIKIFITDLDGAHWTPALPEHTNINSENENYVRDISNPRIVSSLPGDPRHIMVEDRGLDGVGDVYKVDIYAGTSERISRGAERFGQPQVDLKGEIRARQKVDFENGKVYVAQQIKNPDTGAWEEHFRMYAKDRNEIAVVGFSADPNIIYVSSTRGGDKTGIFEYDIRQRKIGEPAFEHKLFEAEDIIQSKAAADRGRVLGFVYGAETFKTYWVDPTLAATAEALNKAMGVKTQAVSWTDPGTGMTAKIATPAGASAQILDFSDDLKYVIVEKSGPNQPPQYSLLVDGKRLEPLGSSRASVSPDVLGDTQLVEYAARDGLMIPAFLHTPPKSLYGPGPYPAIVLPHGGPWARDEMDWDFSGWTKFLTSRGYVVIQPQFRGSEGWGQKLWRAGDAQWGLKMQDDNDDAAKWLISQKLAAPDRIALFGYSYGGYAAFAAAIRPNGLYQCAIAGAGVAEIKNFQGETFDDRFLREFQRPAIDGLDPLPHAKEVSIPMFIYNGDRDQIVEPSESHHFVAALKSAGKPYKYLEIKDMGHTFNTWTSEDAQTQLVEIEKYLKNDCGPGGL